ncbi:hypothetical protein [Streptomyces chrestomyceticus]|uniref:hypothetical protein n=1 Tax=Streptomyces chrestomyceticus TaxID=68185 RepID=UPI0019D23247|nr:hypothetical protein [Streptomyces chrestomyceticus]
MTSSNRCPHCGALLGPSRVHGEGPWNQRWRAKLPEGNQFVPRGKLVGDCQNPHGVIVELQYGHLSENDIQHRERVYGNMVWLFYACHAHSKGRLCLRFYPGRPRVNFAWSMPRETIGACQRTVYLDLGESHQAGGRHLILELKRCQPRQGGRLSGSGTTYTAEAFHNWMAHGIPLTPFIPETTDHAAA